MKSLFYLVVFIALTFSSNHIVAQVTIGTGTNYVRPINRYYNYSASEHIYLKSEINQAGNICEFALSKALGDASISVNDVSIYFKHTTSTTLGNGSTSTVGYTMVYSGAFPNNIASGWTNVTLATPFAYNNVDNLQVLIIKGYEAWTSNYPTYNATNLSSSRSRYWASDGLAFQNNSSYLSQSYDRPNARFNLSCTSPTAPLCVSSPTSPSNGTTGVSASQTLSWSAVSGATGYDVYFGTANPATTLVSSNQSATTYNTGALLSGTTYYWRVVPRNSVGPATGCSTWSFTTCAPSGNPTVYGSGAWIGYVYNSASAGAFTSYQGFVTEATTFNRSHTSASGATINHCSSNQDLFAIRYRNTMNFPAGLYTFTVGGDDGVRFSIDGGASWLINQWVDQGYTTVTSATVSLSGNTNMVFEYYENGGGSQSSFSYTFAPDPCSSIAPLICGTAVNYSMAASSGAWNSYGGPYGVPGQEKIFSFTPTVSGSHNVTVFTSSGYVDLFWKVASTGCNTSGWTYVNDVSGTETWAISLTAGVQYYFLLDDENTSANTGTISISCPTPPPSNDLCLGALPLSCGSTVIVNTSNANSDAIGSTACGTTITTPAVWYQIAGNGQQMTVSTVGLTSSDTKLIVFSGSCSGLTCVGGNDDFNSTQSTVTWNSVSGTTYYVLAALFTGTGSFSMSLNCVTPCPTPSNDVCSSAPILDLGADNSQTHLGTGCGSNIDFVAGAIYKEVWIGFKVPCGGMNVTIDFCGSSPVHDNAYINVFPDCSFNTFTGATTWDFSSCADGNIKLYWNNLPEGTYYYPILIESGWETNYVLNINGTPLVAQPTAPTAITGTPATICHGQSVTLGVSGGSLVGTSQWQWFSGSCGGTPVSVGPSITVTPSATTTYFVQATGNGACPPTACASGTITLPTAGTALSNNNESATCTVNQNGWIHFYHSSGRLIASINSQGQNLGNVVVTSYVDPVNAIVPACDDPSLETAVLQRHWVITPANQPTSNVLVRLPFRDAEYTTLGAAASGTSNPADDVGGVPNFKLSRYHGPANVNANALDNCTSSGGSANTVIHSPAGHGSTTVYSGVNGENYCDYSIPQFSEFWLHFQSDNSPLPVELIAFQGNCTDEGVHLTWQTASESNNDYFVVQRSRDGIDWNDLGTVAGNGNSMQAITYDFVDANGDGGYYYRLVQVDFNGDRHTKYPVFVDCASQSTTLGLYPNPTKDDFTLEVHAQQADDMVQISLVDITGKLIGQRTVSVAAGVNTFHFADKLESGTYLVRVHMKTEVKSLKLVVKN